MSTEETPKSRKRSHSESEFVPAAVPIPKPYGSVDGGSGSSLRSRAADPPANPRPRALEVPAIRGALRHISCLQCAKDAAAGKFTGECHDNSTGTRKRCFRCADRGQSCNHVSLAARTFVRALVAARVSDFQRGFGGEVVALAGTRANTKLTEARDNAKLAQVRADTELAKVKADAAVEIEEMRRLAVADLAKVKADAAVDMEEMRKSAVVEAAHIRHAAEERLTSETQKLRREAVEEASKVKKATDETLAATIAAQVAPAQVQNIAPAQGPYHLKPLLVASSGVVTGLVAALASIPEVSSQPLCAPLGSAVGALDMLVRSL